MTQIFEETKGLIQRVFLNTMMYYFIGIFQEYSGIFQNKSGTYLCVANLEYGNIPKKIWDIPTFVFFGISRNIGIFHFQNGTYKYRKIWDIRNSGIFQKKTGTYKKRQKMEYSKFLEYSGIFHFSIPVQGGGA